MKKRILLGGDFGTNGLKLIAFDYERDAVIASSYQPYKVYVPASNCAEHEPQEWWDAFCNAVAEIKEKGGFAAYEVAALGLSCHCPSVTPMDGDGNILGRAVIWADRRAAKQHEEALRIAGDRLGGINPAAIRAHMYINKLLWLKEEHPEQYDRTVSFLQCSGYIIYRLTGKLSEDRSNAAVAHCYNVNTGAWDEEACRMFGIDMAKLPPLYDCDEIVGTILPGPAAEAGLDPDTPVIAGTADTPAAALGIGCIDEGDIGFSAGTSSSTLMVYDCASKPFRTAPRLMTIGHTMPGKMLNVASMSSTGASLKWMRDSLCREELAEEQRGGKNAYDVMNGLAEASCAAPGGLLFLPYLYGEQTPYFNPDARAVFFGISDTTTKGDMIRAVMEGTCFGFRQNLELLKSVGGVDKCREVIATGGPAASDIWMQILADVSGVQVSVPDTVLGAPLGDVILAGVGAGIYESQEKEARRMMKRDRVFLPDDARARRYDAAFRVYLDLADGLQQSFTKLAEIREA